MITISELTIPAINSALLRIQQGSNSSQPAGTQQVINNVIYKTENSSTIDLTDVNNKIKINSDSITALSGLLNEVISKCSSIDVAEENGEITFFNYEGFDFTINLNDLFTLSASESDRTITLKSKDGTTSTITVPYATNAMNDNNGDQIDTTYQKVEDKGIANGYVPLNAETKIDKEYIPPVSEEDFTSGQWNSINSGITADMIPDQASASNELADKNFVNSSIATNTANFIDTFNSLSELEAYSGTKTNNDYAFVKTTDTAGNVVYKRYKWSASENEWKYEYDLNNSSFTSDQWASINSGVTATSVAQIATNTENLSNKVDKESGKGLSTNDFTTTLKNKLDGIASGAEVNVQSDWDTTDSNADSYIKNKPTIPSVDNMMNKTNPTGTGSFSLNRKANTTIGSNSFAEGYATTASGYASHAEGTSTTASGENSHAEGYATIASGRNSHAEGNSTTASGENQHVAGKYNIANTSSARITGWGTNNSAKKNIEQLDTDGTLRLTGNVYVKCENDSSAGNILLGIANSGRDDTNNKHYIKLTNNLIIQWGSANIKSGTAISFPTSFTNKPTVICTREGSQSQQGLNITSVSTTSFTPQVYGGGTWTFNWIAIGY